MQPDISENPAEPPLVLSVSGVSDAGRRDRDRKDVKYLIFKVASVTPLIDLNAQEIVVVYVEKLRHIELARVARALGIAHLLPVNPDGEGGVNPFEPEPKLVPVLETLRNAEYSHVATTFVVIVRNVWWIYREWVVDVRVLGTLAEALTLPHSRDRYDVPLAMVEISPVKIAGAVKGVRRMVEPPEAGKQFGPGEAHVPGQGSCLGVVYMEMTTWRQSIAVDHLQVIPVRDAFRLGKASSVEARVGGRQRVRRRVQASVTYKVDLRRLGGGR